MNRTILTRLLVAVCAAGTTAASVPLCALADPRSPGADAAQIERGRYLVRIAGCNDCHTPGYPESGGNLPESQWLTGSAVGWQGAWGTTYPANLRLRLQQLDADQWVQLAHTAQFRPPMPWFALRDMAESDLRALHAFVRHLGPAGAPAPDYAPPGAAMAGPVVRFPEPPRVADAP